MMRHKRRFDGDVRVRQIDRQHSSEPAPRSSPTWRPWHDERVGFALTFALISGVLFSLYYFPRSASDTLERWTYAYLRVYARVVSFAIAIFDPHVMVSGNTVAGRFSMQIVKSCDAMEANILFTAAVLAMSAPWRRKGVALAVGLAALAAFNVLRLFVLYWVGVLFFSAFDFMHYDLWPLLMVSFATVDFLVCMRWALRVESRIPVAE
jgi:exosortase/archaeosortase family protein